MGNWYWHRPKIVVLAVILFGITLLFQSWGFFGHRRVNRMAVFVLPPEMVGFYKENIEYVTAHSVDPDKRRYASKNEAPRHYIDIDHYAHHGENPFEHVPRRWNEAVEKFSEDTLRAYGIVPWHVASMTHYLTKAFKERDSRNILRLSADLGHYIADAHVPLHTTENYNGQLTGQKGIHGLWESRIPELTADDFDYLVGRAQYIESPLDFIWDAVEESHSYLDSVLLIEKDLTEKMPSDQKYAMEQRGNSTVRQYSQTFTLAYTHRMGNMVETRMQKAIHAVGSLWYTAWVNAGQPDLSRLDTALPSDSLQKEQEELEKKYSSQKIHGRQHDD